MISCSLGADSLFAWSEQGSGICWRCLEQHDGPIFQERWWYMGYAGNLYSIFTIFAFDFPSMLAVCVSHSCVDSVRSRVCCTDWFLNDVLYLFSMAGCDYCACIEGAELDIATNARTNYWLPDFLGWPVLVLLQLVAWWHPSIQHWGPRESSSYGPGMGWRALSQG